MPASTALGIPVAHLALAGANPPANDRAGRPRLGQLALPVPATPAAATIAPARTVSDTP